VFVTLETLRSKGCGWLANPPTFSDKHRNKLEIESAIDPAVIAERGYRTISWQEAVSLGFTVPQTGSDECLLVPGWNVTGRQEGFQIKPNNPRCDEKGKIIKYETLPGQPNKLDVHPRCIKQIKDPRIDLWITEGMGKTDYLVSQGFCVVGLTGVSSWRWKDPATEGRYACPCWESIAMEDRTIILCFDDDVMTNKKVAKALKRLRDYLTWTWHAKEVLDFDWDTYHSAFGGETSGN
jgi:hypothetical protein